MSRPPAPPAPFHRKSTTKKREGVDLNRRRSRSMKSSTLLNRFDNHGRRHGEHLYRPKAVHWRLFATRLLRLRAPARETERERDEKDRR